MKMKNVFSMKTLSIAVIAAIALLYSCKKDDNSLNSTDSQNVNSEAVSETSSNETADIAGTVINNSNDTQLSGARMAATQVDWKSLDGRLAGATIVITPCCGSTFAVPQGTITITFDGVTADNAGVVRTGVITITYHGRRFQTGSYRIIHFTGYSRTQNSNTITFDNAMVYTVTNVTDSTAVPLKMHHVLENATLTFSSGGSLTRNTNVVVAWDRNAGTITHLAKTQDVAHSAYGTNRKGVSYTMDITKDLVHKISCFASNVYMPVSGTKLFTVGANSDIKYTVDYGSGDCDNTFVVYIGGKAITVTVNPSGN